MKMMGSLLIDWACKVKGKMAVTSSRKGLTLTLKDGKRPKSVSLHIGGIISFLLLKIIEIYFSFFEDRIK